MSALPWEIYFDEFSRRAAPLAQLRIHRDHALSRAAHDAYRATADHLSLIENWDEERTLVVMRAFGEIVKRWIARGQLDLPALHDQLRDWYDGWERG